MSAAIRVENLSKLYQVGARQRGYATLRESLTDACMTPLRHLGRALRRRREPLGQPRLQGEDFWALRRIGFEVLPGEVVGVIGRNGAGKSTLLKILSRITEPTRGRIELRGRVGSLLEVGTGFHPELTGRENIYMNGSILGMSRREINRRFDEIVAFAEIDDFLDTPVKRYSSGMYVRLGFAVAAHLESEIFIVDEVLAVGDAAFQQKCMRKMRDVSRSGRTVLFVSHNNGTIAAVCQRILVLVDGALTVDASVAEGLEAYRAAVEHAACIPVKERRDRRGNGGVRFVDVAACNANMATGDPCSFQVTLQRTPGESSGLTRPLDVAIALRDAEQRRIATLSTHFIGASEPLIGGSARVEFTIPRLPLLAGRYSVDLWCGVGPVEEDYVESAMFIEVQSARYYPTGTDLRMPQSGLHGPVLLDFSVSHS